jgi:signal transduction histidine kinase
LEEDFAVELLAERLRRFMRPTGPGNVPESGPEAAGASRAASSRDEDRLAPIRPTDGIDLEEAWSAVEMVRAEVDGESDPALRASLHHRLDSAALELARAALGQAVYANRRAIEDISHDIRSPLNSILLLTDSLLHGHGGSLNPAQQRQVSVLLTAAVALVRLVNDVMDASRIDSGRYVHVESATFSVNELLTETKRLVSPLAVHRSVNLVFDTSTEQRVGDRQLLCRVLINLASNAVEEVGEGGTVEVRLDGSRQDWLRADVIDTGDKADIDRLRRMIAEDGDFYPRYHQGWARGLGLAISGRLVRRAAGDLSVDRLADGRTCFSVNLPFSRT